MEKKQATTGVVSGDLTKETASDNGASASHKRERAAGDDLDIDKMVEDNILPDTDDTYRTADDSILPDPDTDKTADDSILPDPDIDKMVEDNILPDTDDTYKTADDSILPDPDTDKTADDSILPDPDTDKTADDSILPDPDTDKMEEIVELDKMNILDLMHLHPWAKSPESGPYAMGAWGPGLWSSASASMPFSGSYYIDTWCRGYSDEDDFLCVNGEHRVNYKKVDTAIMNASIQPGSTMVLESKYNVMMYGRSPSSLPFCMNPGEDLRAFGKRTHWSVANVGAKFTSQEYFEKKKIQIKYANFMRLDEEKKATEAFYVPFSLYNMDSYPDLQNAGLVKDFDDFRDLVLPGLWEDIYDTFKGRRSIKLFNVISELVESMESKINATKLLGGQAFLPLGITWWLEMDKQRRHDMTTIYF